MGERQRPETGTADTDWVYAPEKINPGDVLIPARDAEALREERDKLKWQRNSVRIHRDTLAREKEALREALRQLQDATATWAATTNAPVEVAQALHRGRAALSASEGHGLSEGVSPGRGSQSQRPSPLAESDSQGEEQRPTCGTVTTRRSSGAYTLPGEPDEDY